MHQDTSSLEDQFQRTVNYLKKKIQSNVSHSNCREGTKKSLNRKTEYVGHNVNGKYRVQRSLYTFCDMKLKMHINKTWMFSE